MIDRRRRRLLQTGAAALLAAGCSARPTPVGRPRTGQSVERYHVVIVGGGYGGAATARFLKQRLPQLRVTLIEYDKIHATGPGSNWVVGGIKPFPSILARYHKLKKLGVNVIHDWVTAIDVSGRNVRFDDGSRLGYNRLVLAPGVSLDWKAIEGYDQSAAERLPPRWLPGRDTMALAKRLKQLRPGGRVLIAAPPLDATTCPQAIYERASLIAARLERENPAAKLLLLDPSPASKRRQRFVELWKARYGLGSDDALIELVTGKDARVQRVDAVARTIYTGAIEERRRADLISIVPPQRAGALAQAAGLTGPDGWCPVDPVSGESLKVPGIHVIGDAARVPTGRNAHSAVEAARRCARHIAALVLEQEPEEDGGDERFSCPVFSLLDADTGLVWRRRYKVGQGGIEADGPPQIDAGEPLAARVVADWQALRATIWG